MKHAVYGRKLGRKTNHRKALFRNLAAALLQHGQITTTLPKAQAVQPFVEKLITLARKGDLAARRRAIALLQDRYLVTTDKKTGDAVYEERSNGEDRRLIQKLFEDIGPAYTHRPGGYTRIVKLAQHRIGDGANLVVLQLVGDEEGPMLGGRVSRRRQKQDNRTAFAARRRKQRTGAGKPATANTNAQAPPEDAEPADTTTTATATVEEQPPTEAPEATQTPQTPQTPEAPEATQEAAPDESATPDTDTDNHDKPAGGEDETKA